MRVPRIYTQQPLGQDLEVTLEPGPSHHLSKVLRMRAGEPVTLFNGEGGQYAARLVSPDRNRTVVVTKEFDPVERESALKIHLGIAISRGDRMDWIVQKATELGVHTIAPLETERTGTRLDTSRREKKLRHWQHIAIGACEQCGRNRLPDIMPLTPLKDWFENVVEEGRFVLHHRAEKWADDNSAPESAALLVGPEGGLSQPEVDAAKQTGFRELAIGPRVLRTETAPLAAIAILQAHWGDMGFL